MFQPKLLKWQAVTSLQLSREATVLKGAVLYQNDAYSQWREVENAVVTPGSWVRYGSELLVAWTRKQIKKLLECGAIAPSDANLHFDLESVFKGTYTDEKGKVITVANLLRFFRIYTLEQVAVRAMAQTPYSEYLGRGVEKVPLEEILKKAMPDENIDTYIAEAQTAIKEK